MSDVCRPAVKVNCILTQVFRNVNVVLRLRVTFPVLSYVIEFYYLRSVWESRLFHSLTFTCTIFLICIMIF